MVQFHKRKFTFIFIWFAYFGIGIGQTNLIPWLSGEKYGVADEKGRLLVPAKYEEVVVYPDCPLALFKSGGLWGVVDKNGNELLKPVIKGDVIRQYNTLFSGVCLQPALYAALIKDTSAFAKVPLYSLQDPTNRKLYFIHALNPNTELIPFLDPTLVPDMKWQLQWPYSSTPGIINVLMPDTLINFLDTTGRLIFDKGWRWGKVLSPELIAVKNLDNQIVFYNRKGTLVRTTPYSEVEAIFGRELVIGRTKTGSYGSKFKFDLIARNGNVLLSDSDNRPLVRQEFVIVYDSTTAVLYMLSGQKIVSFPNAKMEFIQHSFFDQITLTIKQKIGLIDRTGKVTIEPKYDQLKPATSQFFYFKDQVRAGLVTPDGREVWSRDSIEFDLSFGSPQGYLHIRQVAGKERRYGVVDSTGYLVAQPLYQSVEYNKHWDCFMLENKDSLGVVNKQGTFVFPMTHLAKAGDGRGNPYAIRVADKILFFGNNFSTIGEVAKPWIAVKVIKEGSQTYLVNAAGTKLTNTLYEEIEKATDVISSGPVFIAWIKNAKKDSLHVFNIQGKRIEPSGYVFWSKNVQNASDDAGAFVLTNREDLRLKNRNPRRGLIDGTGKWIIQPDTFDIWVIGSKIIIQQNRIGTKSWMYDKHGVLIHNRPYQYYVRRTDEGISNGLLKVAFGHESEVYHQYLEDNNLQNVKKYIAASASDNSVPKYMYGCIDTSGREVVPVRYTEIEPFEFTYTCAKEVNANGEIESVIITKTGQTLFRTKFDLQYIFREDSTLVLFKQGGQSGIMKVNGEIIIEPRYDQIHLDYRHPGFFLCQDSTSSYIVHEDHLTAPTWIGPNGSISFEKFTDATFRSEIDKWENNAKLNYWHFFDTNGKALSSCKAISSTNIFNHQHLHEGYISIIEKKDAKPYVMNFMTNVKFRDENLKKH